MGNIQAERNKLLSRIESLFEGPMIILGFLWLILLIIELVYKTSPLMETIGVIIWIIFSADFILKFTLAPVKIKFVRSNVLTLASLIVPAFRVFRLIRLLRILRLTRGLRLVRVVGSINRGMRALSATMKRRAFGYVMALTVLLLFVGAAGMYAFERNAPGGFDSYGAAVWWTGMILTTMGSDYWPKTVEGRILCILLALYAFAIFGYVTATLATFFIGRDAEDKKEIGGSKQIEELKKEVRELKEMIRNR